MKNNNSLDNSYSLDASRKIIIYQIMHLEVLKTNGNTNISENVASLFFFFKIVDAIFKKMLRKKISS